MPGRGGYARRRRMRPFPIRRPVLLAAWVLSLLSATAPSIRAQDAWKLPPSGAAEYSRRYDAATGTAPSFGEAQKLAPKDKVPEWLLPHLVPAPWLCQGELTKDQRAVGDEPRDLRDVLRAAAFDLRIDGAVKIRYRRLVPFGDLVLTGKAEPRDAAGKQTFTLAVATEDPEVRPGEARAALQKYVRPLCKYQAQGSLRVERTFDRERGAVGAFDARLELVFGEEKGRFRKLVVTDAQELVALHDNQDAAFRGAVATAIVEGTKWLKREIGDLSRRHFRDPDDGENTYGAGRIALAVLTMLHAEVPGDDPLIAAAFDELRRRELVDTYSLGVSLLALAERYAPPGEAEQLRSGALAAPRPRTLPDADKALAADWLARLLKNVDTRLDPGSKLAFNYTAAPRFDNSVHQYGLLGLYAVSLCQLDVPAATWQATAAHQLGVQCNDNGRQLAPDVMSYRDLAASERGDAPAKRARSAAAVPARGFAYHQPDRPAYGSMTAAGIGSLVIARGGLVRSGQPKAEILPKIDAAVASGFAWLAAEFHVRSNPGFVERADDSWYYYLYGLERTCELAGIARIGGRDWYYEGALQILDQQNKGGSFRSERERGLMLDATCFAILFLKKAALPPITGG